MSDDYYNRDLTDEEKEEREKMFAKYLTKPTENPFFKNIEKGLRDLQTEKLKEKLKRA